MKENNIELINNNSDNYLLNMNKNNSYPDIIQQVDKIITKYKTQLEQLKQKKNYEDYNNNVSNYIPSQRINKINNQKRNYGFNNNNFNKFELNNEDNNNNLQYNFKYESKNNLMNDINNNINNNSSSNLNYEMENDNIKLGSALTLEKSKVIQLLNLLKLKEEENNSLKHQIDDFEIKINDLEQKYQNIIHSIEQQQNNKINELYNKMSNEKNRIQINFEENKKSSEMLLNKYTNELNKSQKILKIFFDFFNKNIEIYKKTEIFKEDDDLFIKDIDYSEDKASLAIETWNKLINKLFQDNKDLYNELIRLKGEIGNYDIIVNQNTNYIQEQNNSLKQLVEKLTFENNFLKKNKSELENKIQNFNNTSTNCHVVHSVCKHCSNNSYEQKKNKKNRDISPIQKLKFKINHLENQIKNQSFI